MLSTLIKSIANLSPQEEANIGLLVLCFISVLIWYTGCLLKKLEQYWRFIIK